MALFRSIDAYHRLPLEPLSGIHCKFSKICFNPDKYKKKVSTICFIEITFFKERLYHQHKQSKRTRFLTKFLFQNKQLGHHKNLFFPEKRKLISKALFPFLFDFTARSTVRREPPPPPSLLPLINGWG